MEDGVSGTMLDTLLDTTTDLDFMDELFLDGCWLETLDGSEFLHQSPSRSGALLDPLLLWPALETDGNLSVSPSQNCSVSESNVIEGSELGTRLWIAPWGNPGSTSSVTDRLIKAIGYIRDVTIDKDVLIQIWVPVSRGGKRILTTSNQPFSLGSSCPSIARYREISESFVFSAEKDSKDLAGLPGRVFLDKVPEWTPDVRFFRSDEYPRVDQAQLYDICGTLALPIFEQGSRTCLGVIEVVMTKQQIKYHPELESVCKALEVRVLCLFFRILCSCVGSSLSLLLKTINGI
jgi:hypothetical protein